MSKADETVALIKEIQDQASALGLTWTLRMGTVVDAGAILVMLKLDGDDPAALPVAATSLAGTVVLGARVMTLAIPPHSLYVLGTAGGTVARELTNRVYQAATADLTLTTTPTLIVGTQVRLSTLGAAQWEVNAVFDFAQTVVAVTTAPTFQGSLWVDGVAQTQEALRNASGLPVNRQTTSQQWVGSLAAGGSHTWELRARVSAVSGTSLARITHTTILVKTYE